MGIVKQVLLTVAISITLSLTLQALSDDSTLLQTKGWTNSLGMAFVKIPAGEFLMGSDEGGDDERPTHQVTISQEFLIAKYEVTVGQFTLFVQSSGYETEHEKANQLRKQNQEHGKMPVVFVDNLVRIRSDATWRDPSFEQNPDHPVVHVTWDDAKAFCAWLSTSDKDKPKGWKYRLPSEAEWEYVARGPKNLKYPFSNAWDGTMCNFADKSSGLPSGHGDIDDGHPRTAPVGSYGAKGDSPFGVSDMAGNASEWCEDCYDHAFYGHTPKTDPLCTKTVPSSFDSPSLPSHVLRGGSWLAPERFCRSSYRNRDMPWRLYMTEAGVGFRVVLAPSK